jgi:hypothetical protein
MELAELTANQTAPKIGALASSDGIHPDAFTHSSSSTSSTEQQQQQQQQQSGSKSTTTTAGSKREEWAQRLTRSLSVLVRMAANAECLHLINGRPCYLARLIFFFSWETGGF